MSLAVGAGTDLTEESCCLVGVNIEEDYPGASRLQQNTNCKLQTTHTRRYTAWLGQQWSPYLHGVNCHLNTAPCTEYHIALKCEALSFKLCFQFPRCLNRESVTPRQYQLLSDEEDLAS